MNHEEREAIIAERIAHIEGLGDSYIREDIDGHTYLWNRNHAAYIADCGNGVRGEFNLAQEGITEGYFSARWPSLNREAAMSVEMGVPIIVGVFQMRRVLLCGAGRLWRALQEGLPTLPAIWFKPELAECCLVFHLDPKGERLT
jgi:hypothetical protein